MHGSSIIENIDIKKKVQYFPNNGIIRLSTSPCGSPVVLVQKKDGTWRMCVEYRALNEITMKNKYHLPRIDDLLDQLKNVVYYTRLDLKSGYHKIKIVENYVCKTLFKRNKVYLCGWWSHSDYAMLLQHLWKWWTMCLDLSPMTSSWSIWMTYWSIVIHGNITQFMFTK